MVLRSKGHKRYYGAALMDYSRAVVYVQKDRERVILAEVPYAYQEDTGYDLTFAAHKDKLEFYVNRSKLIEVQDGTYENGGAGFTISEGTMTCDSFIVSE